MQHLKMELNELSGAAVKIAVELHSKFGPGLNEKIYQKLFCHELYRRGIPFDSQVPIDLNHEGIQYKNAFKADIILERKVIVELKCCKPILIYILDNSIPI